MPLVTLDFETYYDKDYTLQKLSTSEYIRDKRFEAISCSIKIDKKKPFCYFGHDAIAAALDKIEWDSTIILAHHTHFDGLILSYHFGRIPKRYTDTLSMARALHPKSERNRLEDVAIHYNVVNKLPMPEFKGKHLTDLTKEEIKAVTKYNNGDVESCYQAYQIMVKDFPPAELDLIDITVRMFADPVLRVDLPLAKSELKREQKAKAKAIEASGQTIDTLSSNPQFCAALTGLGITIPLKDSPTVKLEDGSPKQIPAISKTDEALQTLLIHPDPKVAALVAGRLAAKSTIGESRALRMIARGTGGKKLPIYLNYALAHTFRWTGGDKFNPQNFVQKQKEGGKLRECILAPPGYVLVVVDAAQIEARIVAWLADEEWVLEAFRQKRDIYSEFASKAYERIITKNDKEERFVGKTCILGLGFGMGGIKLQYTLLTQSINQGLEPVRLPLEVCYRLVNIYRTDCKKIEALWKLLNNRGIGAMISGREWEYKGLVFSKGKVLLPSGLSLLYPGLSANIVRKWGGEEVIHDASYLASRSRSKIYGGLFTENIDQALARIIVANVMRTIALKYRVVMMTHDEIGFLAKKKDAQKALDWAIELMSTAVDWAPTLPLSAEGSYDTKYSK